jgi:hypothetical protein
MFLNEVFYFMESNNRELFYISASMNLAKLLLNSIFSNVQVWHWHMMKEKLTLLLNLCHIKDDDHKVKFSIEKASQFSSVFL